MIGGRIQDSHGETPFDLVSPGDTTTIRLFRKAQVEASVSNNDVASGKRRIFSPAIQQH
jgi:hypothetical protein